MYFRNVMIFSLGISAILLTACAQPGVSTSAPSPVSSPAVPETSTPTPSSEPLTGEPSIPASYQEVMKGFSALTFRVNEQREVHISEPQFLDALHSALQQATPCQKPDSSGWNHYRMTFQLPDGHMTDSLDYFFSHRSGDLSLGVLIFSEGPMQISRDGNAMLLGLTSLPGNPIPVDPQDASLFQRYGWTLLYGIERQSGTLPSSFLWKPGEFPTALYWGAAAALSQDGGLDLSAHLGREVEVSEYVLKERLPAAFEPNRDWPLAMIVHQQGQIVGAWLDGGGWAPCACSLSGRRLEEVTGKPFTDWANSLMDLQDPLVQQLAALSPEEVIHTYYEAAARGDFRMARACEGTNQQELYLSRQLGWVDFFNPQYPGSDDIENLQSVRVLKIDLSSTEGPDLQHGAVLLDVQWKRILTVPNGQQVFFLMLRRESPTIGWRIESIGTGP